MTNQVSESPGFIGRLWREPLFHFLGLAILLFFANALLSGDDRETITVDAATQEYLIDRQQELMLRDLTEAEKSATVSDLLKSTKASISPSRVPSL